RQFTEDPAEIDAMVATYRAYNLAHHDEMVRPYAGVVDAVRSLERRGRALALVTSKLRSGALRGLRLAGLEDAFTVIIGADDVTHPKPHPEPVLTALERLGAPALDSGAPRAGGCHRDAAARRAARVQPVERHRSAARPDRRAVPRGLAGADPRHDRKRGGKLRRLLASDRARRQGRGHAPELP